MTAATIPATVLPRISALVRLLGSPIDGEALNAARALGRTLQGVGADWHALADRIEQTPEPLVILREPPAPWKRKTSRKARPDDVTLDASACRRVGEALWRALASGRLSEWESEFASSLAERLDNGCCRITKKQGDALKRLLAKVGEVSAWV